MRKVIEIKKVPKKNETFPPPEKNLLAAMAPLSQSGASMELLFYHGTPHDDQIHTYLVLHDVLHLEVVDTVKYILCSNGYEIEELSASEGEGVYQHYTGHYPQSKVALSKAETMISHGFNQIYWTSPLLNKDNSQNSIMGPLLDALRQFTDTYVTITLFPTHGKSDEISLVHQLDASLQQQFGVAIEQRGHLYGEAHKAYRQMLEHYQMFCFYISVSCINTGGSLSLAKQLAALIQSNTCAKFRVFPIGVIEDVESSLPQNIFKTVIKNVDKGVWKDKMPKTSLMRLPHLVTMDEALTFFQLPIDDGMTRGIACGGYRPSTELIIDNKEVNKNVILLGTNFMGRTLTFNPKDLNQHGIVTGMPNMGKTTFCENLLYQSHRLGRTFLVLEGEKHDYRTLIDLIPELQIFTPGKDLSPLKLNLFTPPPGINMRTHKDLLWDVFQATIHMEQPIGEIVRESLSQCYANYGWKSYSMKGDPGVECFGLNEFIEQCRILVKKHQGYEAKVTMDVDQGLSNRIGKLLESAQDIFDTTDGISLDSLLNTPTIIELESIRSQEVKNVLVSVLLTYIGALIKSGGGSPGGNLLLFDETHTFLSPERNTVNLADGPNPEKYVTGLIQNLVAEVRGHDCGLFISEQRPNGIGGDILSLCNLHISFRNVEKEQRDIISCSAPYSDEDKVHLARLDMGQCYVYHRGLKYPQLIKTEDFEKTHCLQKKMSDIELCQHCNFHKATNIKPYSLCERYCPLCECKSMIRSDADYMARVFWQKTDHKLHNVRDLIYFTDHIIQQFPEEFTKYEGTERHAAVICARQAFLRKIALKKQLYLPKEDERLLLMNPIVVTKGEAYKKL